MIGPVEGTAWLRADGDPVVLSTRLRLARNLAGAPFPPRCGPGYLERVRETVRRAVIAEPALPGLTWTPVEELTGLDLHLLLERHLVSPAFLSGAAPRGLAFSEDGVASLMVNEEDHLRLQVLLPGLRFEDAWERASRLDDALQERLDFAYDAEFGFLTSCPTNVGTGLRASAMLHLPALVRGGGMEKVVAQITRLGLAVRGLYGEGTGSAGNLFQISNQYTTGASEEELLDKVRGIATQIVDYEKGARESYRDRLPDELYDSVWRALGTLRHCWTIDTAEALEKLSLVRLGVDLGILPSIPVTTLNCLLVRTRPATLQAEAQEELDPAGRDRARARVLRETMARVLAQA